MTTLKGSTLRRLQKLPQMPSVWEGDRRPLPSKQMGPQLLAEMGGIPDCILWVDSSQGLVRTSDIVPPSAGPEVLVRSLLTAMEQPIAPSQPARPRKILVCDRETQFFLRGALQDLNITVAYAPELPRLDFIFNDLLAHVGGSPPLPPQYQKLLMEKALQIWRDAPWEYLKDHQIIAVELNQGDIGTLYTSILGFLGADYSILLYRSVDSLRQFRQQVLKAVSLEQKKAAFLAQDCLLVSYEAASDEEVEGMDLATLPESDIQPDFGNLHPLEGIRQFLHKEEAIVVCMALEALHRFFGRHGAKLSTGNFPTLKGRYKIPIAQDAGSQKRVVVEVKALPDLSDELLAMTP